jgi:hypothetical protein
VQNIRLSRVMHSYFAQRQSPGFFRVMLLGLARLLGRMPALQPGAV